MTEADALPPEVLKRLSRVAQRHPNSALLRLAALEHSAKTAGQHAAASDALYAHFYLLEHRGRALELQAALLQAQADLDVDAHPLQGARLHEALGRIAYQQGEYFEATEHWNQSAELAAAVPDARAGAAARIGLGQIHYAFGAWARGREVHGEAAQLLGAADDSYLAAKLALNIGVGHFETHQLDDAERHFSHGLAAARRGQHREYEAEAHWQLARAALARGRLDWATVDCRLALSIAAKLGHSWLEAAASRTWTDISLARGDRAGAIRSTEHGLLLANRIHSRPQQSQAHLLLAKLHDQQGDKDAAIPHLWQHLNLQAEIERLSSPVRPGLASFFDPARQAAEAQLLSLSNRRWKINHQGDRLNALAQLCAEAQQILRLGRVQFWWVGAKPAAQAGGFPSLRQAEQSQYLDWLNAAGKPQALGTVSNHPFKAELSALPEAAGTLSRIELPLYVKGEMVAVLWLAHCQQKHLWSRQDQLQASHLARLFELALA
ncbi:GAF domain-containing protein [Paucibacter sp. B2R-40]|uniref:GAF domain-containing protein n=1 Tax=Paucibacter sp. B2R-40 TaxID=2893554 RepID=UPI0021E3AFCE|nr:GAF domain-containing protein [Paucibacter sp. B2R-40]MCV2353313.1 GAF domain-containing protein [Paucibacter sp. B2R-40]